MKLKSLAFLFLVLSARGQQYFFKNYSVENGLPFVQVSCIFQDRNGYLWSGGYGGLSRFDGKLFVNYNKKNGLIDHNVNAITADSSGRVFIGTNKGLSVLNGKKFINYARNEGLENIFVTALCRDSLNRIFIGTNEGVYMFQNDKISRVRYTERMAVNSVCFSDRFGLVVCTDSGLALVKGANVRWVRTADGLPSLKVNCSALKDDMLAIGTDQGLTLYNVNSGKNITYRMANGLIDENITDILNTHDGFLWIASASGLMRFNGAQFNYYNIAPENNSNHVRCLAFGREGNMWIGTHSGLYRYRDNSFATFDKNKGIANGFIFQILRDEKNGLWICTQNNGVFRWQGDDIAHYTSSNGLTSNTARSAILDSESRLLFGSAENLLQFVNGRFRIIPLPQNFKPPYEVLYEAHDRTLWIGGSNGFCSLKWDRNKAVTKFYFIPSKYQYSVYGFCEDNRNRLYVGTYKAGLWRLSGDTLINLSTSMNLGEETFFTLRYKKGKIFAASLNGLLVLDPETSALTRITEEDGLNSDLVYSIELTEHGRNLWIGTNQGINRFDVESYLQNGSVVVRSFGRQDGFGGVECNTNGIWEDPDGTMWFGTVSGLISHQPDKFKRNESENVTLIQNIKIQNEDTLLPQEALLSASENNISFYYRGICLTNPEKVLYQRKLEGLDKDWSTPGPEDYIKYTNLPPGPYKFRVRSCNNEGIWNTEDTSFSFTIARPFYLTWWFIVLTIAFTFFIIYLIFFIRLRNLRRKQKAELERKVEMSKIELKALRAQMNPHFIFNSLNAIQHYIFNTRAEEAVKYLNKFARLVRTILNNSEKPSVTVGEDLEALKLYLELEQMRFEGKFDYVFEVDETVDIDYDIMPPLLMQPYVENAILHGINPMTKKGLLTIRLTSENNFLICMIEDNGIGRGKASEIKRTMPLKNHRSMGMKITEERLRILNELQHSDHSVNVIDLFDDNNEPAGTRVYLYIPLTG